MNCSSPLSLCKMACSDLQDLFQAASTKRRRLMASLQPSKAASRAHCILDKPLHCRQGPDPLIIEARCSRPNFQLWGFWRLIAYTGFVHQISRNVEVACSCEFACLPSSAASQACVRAHVPACFPACLPARLHARAPSRVRARMRTCARTAGPYCEGKALR